MADAAHHKTTPRGGTQVTHRKTVPRGGTHAEAGSDTVDAASRKTALRGGKLWGAVLAIVLVAAAVAGLGLWLARPQSFRLEDEAYGTAQITEITADQLNQLIAEQKSFAVVVYQSTCSVSANFEALMQEFVTAESLSLYKIKFSALEEAPLGESVKFYPSLAIYHAGELVDFLEANQDEDTEYYKDQAALRRWFTTYVEL